jgi:hypothetical protein
MRSLFLTTAAFAALMLGAPTAHAMTMDDALKIEAPIVKSPPYAHATTVMSNCVEGDICPTVNAQDAVPHTPDLRLKPIPAPIQFSNCLDQAAADEKYMMSFANRAENAGDWIANTGQKYRAAIHECYANRGF